MVLELHKSPPPKTLYPAFIGHGGLLWAVIVLMVLVLVPRPQAAVEPASPRIRTQQPELIIFHYDYGDKAHWHCQKAEAYRVHRMFWQAEREYLLALRFPLADDYKATIYNNLGTIADHLNRPNRAQAYYRKALQYNPIQLVTYRNWMRALQTMMSDADIEQALLDWHETDRDNIIPRYTLSLLYEEQDRQLKALRTLEALLADIPYSPISDIATLRKAQLQSTLEMLAKPPRVHIE